MDPAGWKSQDFLPARTVSWFWYVTPQKAGEHELLLDVEPIVALAGVDISAAHDSWDAQTGTYAISVDVSTPPAAETSSIEAVVPAASAQPTSALIAAAPPPTACASPSSTPADDGWVGVVVKVTALIAAIATLLAGIAGLIPGIRGIRKPAPVKDEAKENVKTP